MSKLTEKDEEEKKNLHLPAPPRAKVPIPPWEILAKIPFKIYFNIKTSLSRPSSFTSPECNPVIQNLPGKLTQENPPERCCSCFPASGGDGNGEATKRAGKPAWDGIKEPKVWENLQKPDWDSLLC